MQTAKQSVSGGSGLELEQRYLHGQTSAGMDTGLLGGNCISQCMKSNSRLFRKYLCVRKICFRFLRPLCILISFSGAAVVVMLLNSRARSHQIHSLMPSILWNYVGFYKLLSSGD